MKTSNIVDFHSHCLPQMDDGAVDMAESLAMLEKALEQGVNTLVATPHFYGRDEQELEAFLSLRNLRLEQLRSAVAASPALVGRVRILAGAEVLVQEGVSRLPLERLCIEGSRRILLELPFSFRPMWLYEELESIAYRQNLRPVMAHLDRYRPWYTREHIADLLELPHVWIQLNGEAIERRRDITRLAKWLPRELPMVFGSDMHHVETRGQVLGHTCRILRKSRQGRLWLQSAQAIRPNYDENP